MKVEFISDYPQSKARPRLDEVLRNGVDQLAIACAFCTKPGVNLLMRHVDRLRNHGSFLVVAASDFTDYTALGTLNAKMLGNLFAHWGSIAPRETKAGCPLMHSKVFYARRGGECWLWTGSHNLTASATQGLNCEAAVLLHGDADEQPFVDALMHLEACRDAALPYDPDTSWEKLADPDDILVIHAEAVNIPSGPFPLHVHLCLEDDQFDDLLARLTDLKLFLYAPGSLVAGWQKVAPIAAMSGSLTGINLTGKNPRSRGSGTAAEWAAAHWNIEPHGKTLVLVAASPPNNRVTTQAVINITGPSRLDEILLAEEPRITKKLISGKPRMVSIDSDMVEGFSKVSTMFGMVEEVPVTGRKLVVSLGASDARDVDLGRIRELSKSIHSRDLMRKESLEIDRIEISYRNEKKEN